jgi:hypothetical protein
LAVLERAGRDLVDHGGERLPLPQPPLNVDAVSVTSRQVVYDAERVILA